MAVHTIDLPTGDAMPTVSHLCKETLGYQIHTNRELGMMLLGQKPLAVFSDVEGRYPTSLLRYLRMFDRHVRTGRFVSREHREPLAVPGNQRVLLTIFYALPHEVWRIDSMIDLRHNLSAWTPEHERMEGELLGYTTDQNDIWIRSGYAKRMAGSKNDESLNPTWPSGAP